MTSHLHVARDKVLLALSGGVDSCVCAKILQEQGFDVTGLYIVFSPAHEKGVAAARQAAKELSIPLEIANVQEAFDQKVIDYFCRAYSTGLTPNPCVVCNPMFKFHTLQSQADAMGIRYLATGHYARVAEENGLYYVARAESTARDQSYMLYRLPQEVLRRLCLPLGEFEKPVIREMAKGYGLSSADTPDSQEICFIPGGNYAAFIEERGISSPAGRFIGPKGEDLGPHKGIAHYTVGQRRGLGISYKQPVFVKSIGANGDIHLALGGDEYVSSVILTDMVSTSGLPPAEGEAFEVKIRSAAKPVACTVGALHGGEAEIVFAQPQRAAAPGQSAVLYKGNLVVGGGVIKRP